MELIQSPTISRLIVLPVSVGQRSTCSFPLFIMDCSAANSSWRFCSKRQSKKNPKYIFSFICYPAKRWIRVTTALSPLVKLRLISSPGYLGEGTHILLWLESLLLIFLLVIWSIAQTQTANPPLPGRRLWGVDLGWKSSGLSAGDRPSRCRRGAPPLGWDLCERARWEAWWTRQLYQTAQRHISPVEKPLCNGAFKQWIKF